MQSFFTVSQAHHPANSGLELTWLQWPVGGIQGLAQQKQQTLLLQPLCEAKINNFPHCKQMQLLNLHSPLLLRLPLGFLDLLPAPSSLPGHAHRVGLVGKGRGVDTTGHIWAGAEGPGTFGNPSCGSNTS